MPGRGGEAGEKDGQYHDGKTSDQAPVEKFGPSLESEKYGRRPEV
jgi:hypothetical protein